MLKIAWPCLFMNTIATGLLCVQIAAADGTENTTDVPDPFGLGERLALIDYCQEHQLQHAGDTSLTTLRKLYRAHATSPRNYEDALERNQKQRLTTYLQRSYFISLPLDATLEELQAIREDQERLAQQADDDFIQYLSTLAPSAPHQQQNTTTYKTPSTQKHPQQTSLIKQQYFYPPACAEKIRAIPDLYQASRELGMEEGGAFHCAPTAVSNSFIWLARNGYPKLAFNAPLKRSSHYKLAQLLSTDEYMATNTNKGSYTTGVITAVSKHVRESGYKPAQLSCMGFRVAGVDSSWERPTFDFIKDNTVGTSVVWLALGFYQYDQEHDLYTRYNGHLITVTGYGVNKRKQKDPNILVFNDPGAGKRRSSEYMPLTTLPQGKLSNGHQSIPAAGNLIFAKEYPFVTAGTTVIIETAIALRMK